MYSLLVINTDDDAIIHYNGQSYSDLEVLITGETDKELREKSIDLLSKLTVTSHRSRFVSELMSYFKEISEFIISNTDSSLYLGGNRTVHWCLVTSDYVSNRITI